jgi:hypothetical protein
VSGMWPLFFGLAYAAGTIGSLITAFVPGARELAARRAILTYSPRRPRSVRIVQQSVTFGSLGLIVALWGAFSGMIVGGQPAITIGIVLAIVGATLMIVAAVRWGDAASRFAVEDDR